MRLSELSKMIVPLYNTGTPVTLVGAPGIGKSDAVHELPQVLSLATGEEFGHVTVEASTLDAPDVIGFLIPTKGPNGEALARYTKPDMVRQIEATGLEHGILFIDEIGQADTLVQKSLASLFIEGKLGEYRVPDGWYVISATNRVEDRAGVVKELSHFTNRQCRVDIDANIDDWMVWARDHGVHHMMMAFANFRPGVVMADKVPTKPGPYCTPRSFTAAAKFLNELIDDAEDDIPADGVTQAIVSGYIGEGASAELFAFLKVNGIIPSWDDITKDPKGCKAPPDDRLDAAYACAGLIAAKADGTTVDKAFQFATRLPIELQTSIAKTLVTTMGGSALNSPAIAKFVSEHKALILGSID
ncbi:MAG: hypothetical protein DRI24_20020 [Deltaproteobacteria bacterium]|nr:MAG: hypothetical protein DRI24_20020 [Deltaproteobacteria bacterium]